MANRVLLLVLGEGTVTNGSWKAKCVSHGPVGGDTRNPRVETTPLPADWFAVDFDDSGWKNARGYSEQEIDPKQPYHDADFTGAKFIWTDDVVPQGPTRGGGRRPPGTGRPPR